MDLVARNNFDVTVPAQVQRRLCYYRCQRFNSCALRLLPIEERIIAAHHEPTVGVRLRLISAPWRRVLP